MLSDAELRARPQQAVDALCDFLRLPRVDVSGAAAAGDAGGGGGGGPGESGVEAALEVAFPNFGARTGWRLSGRYAPPPPETRALLAEFYAPHNRALYEYLGRDFGWQQPAAA